MTAPHITHRTVEAQTRPSGDLDLTRASLFRLHGLRYDLPALTHRRVTRVARADTGWSVQVGYLSAMEVFLAITSPYGDTVLLTRPGAIDGQEPLRHFTEFDIPLRGVFAVGRESDPRDLERGDASWQTATRMHGIAGGLTPPTEAQRLKVASAWHRAHHALLWALFPDPVEGERWRRIVGNPYADDARTYARAGCTPEWSAPWITTGYQSPEIARDLDAHGWPPREARTLHELFEWYAPADPEDPNSPDFGDYGDWIESGVPPRLAVLAYAAGLTVTEARDQADALDETVLRALAALRGVEPEVLAPLATVPTEVLEN